ncbi:MAG TPA: alpha/beta fold hydrolase [Rhodopila sp.]
MGLIFKDDLHERLGTWALGYIPYGGADFGEILAVAAEVTPGDDSSFHDAWSAAADRLAAAAQQAEADRRLASARELYLRASGFYATAYHPLYGEPVDPRLLTGFRKQIAAFNAGLRLSDPPVAPTRIPFEATTLPAYVIPAVTHPNEPRPLLILTNGYDATVTDLYFASAVAASRRGYHCLIFDGPGQGEMLYEHGMRLRPDWETVVSAVVDHALTLPIVDPARIAIVGWSLGGYLAPRAASGEHRLAACVADPGLWSIAAGVRDFAIKLGATPEGVANLASLDPALIDRMRHVVSGSRDLHWSVVRRGFWANGAADLADYLRLIEAFTMEGRAQLIRCPTLLTRADGDPLGAQTESFYQALRCPRTLMPFHAAEGAGMHCEMMNRSLVNRRVLDWLDAVLQ